MSLDEKNQNDNIHNELINSYEIEYIFGKKPINRFNNKPVIENIQLALENLKTKI